MPNRCDGTPTAAEEGHARILELEDQLDERDGEAGDMAHEIHELRVCLREIQAEEVPGFIYCKIRDILKIFEGE